ncbi:MAG TPA: sensor histidine kinase [Polyangiaceae bacterium]|jgi:signal transduction histidine kinase
MDAALRVVGLVVWLVVGSPVWLAVARGEAHANPLWLVMYVAFAIALVLATRPSGDRRVRVALLAFQSLAAIVLAILGMPHFEGALLALVAAQVATVVPIGVALAWSVAQAVPLFVIVLPTHALGGAAKATGEYLAFAVFAGLAAYLRERESAARRELAREHAALLATQALLADGARAHERMRLAREVHDAIGHGLAAASVNLELAARTQDAAALESAREAVRTTLGELRGLVIATRAPRGIDLETALRVLCSGVREPRVDLEVAADLEVTDEARAHALFRATQEALTNAVKHARARTVRVSLARDGTEAIATVRDDGVGAADVTRGNGLDGLRERLAELGGELAIETRPNEGFTVRARIPLEGSA